MTEARYEAKRKPRRCPACGSARVARILWGMPAYSEQLEQELAEGKIVLGGCCVSGDDPAWACADCDASIYREVPSDR
jgi:ribosomal protein L37AE/L43A